MCECYCKYEKGMQGENLHLIRKEEGLLFLPHPTHFFFKLVFYI